MLALQQELAELKSTETPKRSIFEDELVLKSVSLSGTGAPSQLEEADDEVCALREQLARLRGEFAAHRMESSSELKRARRSVKELASLRRRMVKESGIEVAKDLSCILDMRHVESVGAVERARIERLQAEMRRLLQGCAATVRWIRDTAKFDM